MKFHHHHIDSSQNIRSIKADTRHDDDDDDELVQEKESTERRRGYIMKRVEHHLYMKIVRGAMRVSSFCEKRTVSIGEEGEISTKEEEKNKNKKRLDRDRQ